MKYFVILFGFVLSTHSFAEESKVMTKTKLAGDADYKIILKNHRFTPAITTIPAGKKVKLLVENQDATIDEFHSDDLGVEKVISGNNKGVISIGPLKPGKYTFMGEFNAKTAQGAIVAK
jgi:Cupredoxin-like domain